MFAFVHVRPVDKRRQPRQIAGMRFLVIPLLLCVAGCSGDPSTVGITGPGQIEAPKPRDEVVPGGDPIMPQARPDTGSGKFWGYN